MPQRLAAVLYAPESAVQAQQQALQLGLPALPIPAKPTQLAPGIYLVIDPRGLALRLQPGGMQAALSLQDVQRRLAQGRQLDLARACGLRPGLRILDAMAGFGLDGITLAALGAQVTLVERDGLLQLLLADALLRSAALHQGRAQLRAGDVSQLWSELPVVEVIYLDPMFSERRKQVLPNKRAQVLAALQLPVPGPAALQALLDQARALATERVVLKRRRQDPVLAHPDWQIQGRAVRFDVYRPRPS